MGIRKKFWLFAAATFATVSGLGIGCASELQDSSTQRGREVEPGALSPQELVGKLACGESKRVHHSGDSTYQGLQIEAPASTTLTISVTMPEGKPRIWLQSATATTRAKAAPVDGEPASLT